MNHKKISAVFILLFLASSLSIASELEDAVAYGNLLTKSVKAKEDVELKKFPEYKGIKQYLSQNKCPGFKYKDYIVGPKDKKYFYLVASKGKDVIIGRHFRAPVNNGAIALVSFESSTNGCLNLGAPSSDVAALTATHLKPYPNEFHVLQSQLAGLALYIGTSAGIYSVEGGQIRVVEKK